jgi:hypothetical protein
MQGVANIHDTNDLQAVKNEAHTEGDAKPSTTTIGKCTQLAQLKCNADLKSAE